MKKGATPPIHSPAEAIGRNAEINKNDHQCRIVTIGLQQIQRGVQIEPWQNDLTMRWVDDVFLL